MERKDNLTDLIENVQNGPAGEVVGGGWEVIGIDGEVIMLGEPGGRRIRVPIKKGLLAITPEQLQAIIDSTVRLTADDMGKRVAKLLGEKGASGGPAHRAEHID